MDVVGPAAAGECEENPEAMLRLCPTSCGLCTPECKESPPQHISYQA